MSSLSKMYWFKDFWMHELYIKGVEASAEQYINSIPIGGCIVDRDAPFDHSLTESIIRWNRSPFYWRPVVNVSCVNGCPTDVTMVVKGYRLYGKNERNSTHCTGVIRVEQDNNDETTTRMYACKDFACGDAITLVSKLEVSPKRLFLGGVYARVSDDPTMCNAYLTKSGVLRAISLILSNREIVRLSEKYTPEIDYEQLDRVVLSKDLLKGRVTDLSENRILHIEYEDGTTERIDKDEVEKDFRKGWCQREEEEVVIVIE